MFVAVLFSLSACTDIACLSGVCPTIEERMAQIPWEPPSLSHQNCPNISGKYKARLYAPNGINYIDLIMQFPQSNDQLGFIHARSEESAGQVPRRYVPNPSDENPRRVRVDESEFYNSGAYVLIQQSEHELAVSLIGGDGKLYRKQTVSLDSPMIGCANGDLIIRTIYPPGRGEGGWGSTSADGERFRKLADGSLQVMTHIREWRYDPVFGLMGMGPTGGTNSTGMPREGRYTKIYAGVP